MASDLASDSGWNSTFELLPGPAVVLAVIRVRRFLPFLVPHCLIPLLLRGFILIILGNRLGAQGTDEFEHPPIEYSTSQPNDAVTALNARLLAGTTRFPVGTDREMLRWLLREFRVPEASQVLVFSQTSFQNDRIRPEHPRAIYFNDQIYVGWVPGGLAEVSAVDPKLGPTFYAFDPRTTESKAAVPSVRFRREADCLRCHGTFVRDIPSVFARSVIVDFEGRPTATLGGKLVDFTTPFSERWGGWYVTGTHGDGRHRGNVVPADGREFSAAERQRGANVTNLSAFVDTSQYLAPGSDIAALLVLEHQLTVQNAITRAGHHVRRLMHYQQGVQRGLGENVTSEPVYDSTRRAIAATAQDLLDALLSYEEAALPVGGVKGTPAFRQAYEATGPKTRQGRGLHELELQTRVYRYRCSPLIYSSSFAGLPAALKSEVFRRLKIVLSHLEADPRYIYLRPAERRMIREILRETLPEYAKVDR